MEKKKETASQKAQQEDKKEPEKSAESPEEQTEQAPAENKELEEAKAQAEDFKRKWYSVTAEYENYRRRTLNQSAARYAEGRSDVVVKLFPIADSLELALQSCADEGTKKGIELVMKSFSKLLAEENIEVIDPAGAPFDAETCEAILARDAKEGEESGTVETVFRKGYAKGGKVLRFAQVSVIR